MEIGAALGATACQTTQDDNLITKGRMGKKSNGTITELYTTGPHFFRARRARPHGQGLSERDPGEGERAALLRRDGAERGDYEYYAAALAWTGDPRR